MRPVACPMRTMTTSSPLHTRRMRYALLTCGATDIFCAALTVDRDVDVLHMSEDDALRQPHCRY
eukprot:3593442-Pyramimonas_sp.AAC.1